MEPDLDGGMACTLCMERRRRVVLSTAKEDECEHLDYCITCVHEVKKAKGKVTCPTCSKDAVRAKAIKVAQ